MNFDEIIEFLGENPTIDLIKSLLKDKKFDQASQMGLDYAKNNNFKYFDNAPFCINEVPASNEVVFIEPQLIPLIENMKNIAVSQSDTENSINTNYEAMFYLIGEKRGNIIVLSDGAWDETGYVPNKPKYYDPDDYSSMSIYSPEDTAATASKEFVREIKSKLAESQSEKKVVIFGHTHPKTRKYGLINNYASHSDIVASVEEALNFYQQENGTCEFLNAIINADGDFNIYGFDVENLKFKIINNVICDNKRLKCYTDGLYPLSKPTGQMGEY